MRAVELGVGEHRLDELLSLSVELAAAVGVQDAAHERVEAAVPARPGALRRLESGGISTWMPSATMRSICSLVPVAGVGDDNVRRVGDADGLSSLRGGVEHRFEVPEVGRVDRDLGGDDDLLLVGRRLGVVALQPARAAPLTNRESGSVILILPGGLAGGR